MKLKQLLTTLTAAAALALVASARAEINLTDWHPMTNQANLTITNLETRTITGSVIELRKNIGLSFLPTFRTTNDSTADVIWKLYVSADGTNWSTTSLNYTNALDGTNWVRGYKYWSPDVLGGVRFARFGQIVNGHTASITVSNGIYSRFN